MSSTTESLSQPPLLDDFGKMEDHALFDLRQRVEAEWKKRESRHKREARKQIVALAVHYGIDLSTVANDVTNDTVKYRDPENQFNIWKGRGRKPEWLQKALEKGIKLDDLKT